jgi:hypothetical protein
MNKPIRQIYRSALGHTAVGQHGPFTFAEDFVDKHDAVMPLT